MISIIADFREKPSGIIEILSGLSDVEYEFKNLPLGDYLIDDKWLFERKTLKDFSSSIIDGRLFNQAFRLVNSPQSGVLILEGDGEDAARLKIRREALQGALIKLSICLKIPVLRSRNIRESLQLMLYVAKQFQGLTENSVWRQEKVNKGKRRTQLQILKSLPDVGIMRAKLLLEKFGSVSAVMQSDISELTQVSGIGRKIATKIHWAIK